MEIGYLFRGVFSRATKFKAASTRDGRFEASKSRLGFAKAERRFPNADPGVVPVSDNTVTLAEERLT